MGNAWRLALGFAIVVALATSCAGGSDDAEPAATTQAQADPASALTDELSTRRIRTHLAALQRIADRNGRNRAAGTPGYAASVRYVRDELRRLGYRPEVSNFPFVEYTELRERATQLAPRTRRFRVEAIDYSPSTPPGGVRGRLVPSGDGCQPTDFGRVRGRIALAERGTCFIAVKAQNAGRAGAVALVVFTPEPGPIDATLGDPRASTIPVVAVDRAVAQSFLNSGAVEIQLDVKTRRVPSTSQNVVADTHPSAARVLLVGAHLDSVVTSAGINDNGTGVAALLEIARVLREIEPQLAVRFGFWGAEELGLFGSSAYAQSVPPGELVGYLNFDMLGSRERLRAVYTGPFAGRWLQYFREKGLPAETIDMSGRADHVPFEQRGIPTGGLFAGFDECYHAPCDRILTVDLRILEELAAGIAWGIATLAPKP